MSHYIAGIDVSHYQGDIDWQRVKSDGYEFSYIKATESVTGTDQNFRQNWQDAKSASLLRGPYHFFHPKVDVQKQAAHFLSVVENLESGDLPTAIDAEAPSMWAHLSTSQSVDLVLEWCESVMAKLSFRPIIYASPAFVNEVFGNDPRLADYLLWLAQYTKAAVPNVPRPWQRWTFWQHSEKGRVEGIDNAPVDLNFFNGSIQQLRELTKP